jgi:hypothetical protein
MNIGEVVCETASNGLSHRMLTEGGGSVQLNIKVKDKFIKINQV